MAKLLHKAIGLGGKPGDQQVYDDYMKHFESSPVATLRDALELKSQRAPIDVSEVESVETIMSRFCTGGMSLGAISRETHETIAIAMNRCARCSPRKCPIYCVVDRSVWIFVGSWFSGRILSDAVQNWWQEQ